MNTGTDVAGAPGARRDHEPTVAARVADSLRWTGPGRAVGRGLQFVFQLLLIRGLGPASYGLYALGFSLIDILKQISLAGVQNGLLRFGPVHIADGDYSSLRKCVRFAFSFVLGLGAVLAAAQWLAADALAIRLGQPDLAVPLRWFAPAVPAFAVLLLVQYSFRALRRIDLDVLVSDLVQPVAAILLVAGLLALGTGLPAAVGAFAASCALAAIVGAVALRRVLRHLPRGEDRPFERLQLLRVSLPILMVEFGFVCMGHIDKLLLGHFVDAAELGRYAAAFRLSRQIAFLQMIFTPAFTPLISSLVHRRRTDELADLYRLTARWILLAALPMVSVLVVFGDVVLRIFGEAFVAARIPLALLAAGQIANQVGLVAAQILQLGGRQDRDLGLLGLALATNIGLNLWWIPHFGGAGAALATGVSVVILAAGRVAAVRSSVGVLPFSGPLLRGLAMFAVITAGAWAARPLAPGIGGAALLAALSLTAYVALAARFATVESDREFLARVTARGRFRGR